MPKLYQNLLLKINTANEDKATLEGIFSTADEDRHGDVVQQNWDLKNFKKNPVILNSHSYRDAADVIGKAVGIKVSKDGVLEGTIQFAVNENPKAKIIFDLYKGGFLNAFSVGFLAKEFDNKGTILKSELLEISAVSVPANAYALAKAKGIQVEKLYEDDDTNTEHEEGNGEGTPGDGDDNKDSGEPAGGDGDGGEGGEGGELKGKAYDNAERWDEGDEEIRYKLRSMTEFDEDTFERSFYRQNLPSIAIIIGKQTGRQYKGIQLIKFPKEEGWCIDDAKEWVLKNTDKITTFRKDIIIPDEIITEEKIIEKTQNRFDKIQKAIQLVGEDIKVETRSLTVRAENNRLLNKTIRELLKLKS